ncbi:hypothetical protein ACOMHN_015602 [Nucella lapillus]
MQTTKTQRPKTAGDGGSRWQQWRRVASHVLCGCRAGDGGSRWQQWRPVTHCAGAMKRDCSVQVTGRSRVDGTVSAVTVD